MDITVCIDTIWGYSKYYGDLVASSQRFFEMGEGYAAFLMLFNATELIFKSLRESDKETLACDINYLKTKGILEEEEAAFFLNENGPKRIRNIMTHRDLYQYCFEIDNKAYFFADRETWSVVYEKFAPTIIVILYNAILRNNIIGQEE